MSTYINFSDGINQAVITDSSVDNTRLAYFFWFICDEMINYGKVVEVIVIRVASVISCDN